MSNNSDTSSAAPNELFAYASSGLNIDAQLEASSARLAAALDQFTATCREYSLGIDSSLAQQLQAYARRTSDHDLWVRRVAEQFVLADQCSSGGDGLVMGAMDGGSSVADWDASRKVEAAVERAIEKLPAALAAQLRALLTPENVAALVIILGIWAASQAVGIGEIMDLILAVGGIVMLGPEAIRAVQELAGFATGAIGAQSDADLDEAGGHLANAIAIVGVDGAMTLLAHKASGAAAEGVPKLVPGEAEFVTPDGVRVRLTTPTEPVPSSWDLNARPVSLQKTVGELVSEMSHEAYGPARGNNSAEFEQIMADLEQSGVSVSLDPGTPLGQGVYGPSSSPANRAA